MAKTSELIEFRRAFVWLLCAVLVPSVALVAFGVVAVANERAAVERRLAEEYGAKLKAVERELDERLQAAAASAAAAWAEADRRGGPLPAPADPLVTALLAPEAAEALGLLPALRRAAALPPGGHLFSLLPGGPEQGLFVVVHRA